MIVSQYVIRRVLWPGGLVHWAQVLVGSNPGLAGRGACVLEQVTKP